MMIRILALIVFLSPGLLATDKVQTIVVTIPVPHTWDEGDVKWARIPYTGWDIDNPYHACAFYAVPHIVFQKQKHLKQDINLISVYNITVDSSSASTPLTESVSSG